MNAAEWTENAVGYVDDGLSWDEKVVLSIGAAEHVLGFGIHRAAIGAGATFYARVEGFVEVADEEAGHFRTEVNYYRLIANFAIDGYALRSTAFNWPKPGKREVDPTLVHEPKS